jgi:hypothetical protein
VLWGGGGEKKSFLKEGGRRKMEIGMELITNK